MGCSTRIQSCKISFWYVLQGKLPAIDIIMIRSILSDSISEVIRLTLCVQSLSRTTFSSQTYHSFHFQIYCYGFLLGWKLIVSAAWWLTANSDRQDRLLLSIKFWFISHARWASSTLWCGSQVMLSCHWSITKSLEACFLSVFYMLRSPERWSGLKHPTGTRQPARTRKINFLKNCSYVLIFYQIMFLFEKK